MLLSLFKDLSYRCKQLENLKISYLTKKLEQDVTFHPGDRGIGYWYR